MSHLVRRKVPDLPSRIEEGRFECKYILPAAERQEVLERSAQWLRPDPHAVLLDDGTTGYHVHSMYYDTANLEDYAARLNGGRIRQRLRVRTYGKPGQQQPVFLENKRKLETVVVKSRVSLSCDADVYGAVHTAHPWKPFFDAVPLAGRWAASDFDRLASKRGAVTCVHYRRDVYCGRSVADPTRVTIDRSITASTRPDAWDLYAEPDLEVIPGEFMVLELKFNGQAPKWIRDMRSLLRLHAESVSKFGSSVAAGARTGSTAREQHAIIPRSVVRALGAR